MTAHFEDIIKDEMKREKEEAALMDSSDDDEDFHAISSIRPLKDFDTRESLDYEVADVNFGKSDTRKMNKLS